MHKRKLIEVALPLEAINRESAREKSIRHGHPSTLHLWWARRPLAAARAVLFAQLVDDPSSHPDRFPTEEAQRAERERLHGIIERLVVWENTRDEKLLAEARAEVMAAWDGNPPPILDPFAGGGTIPLEAQRLGLQAYASDLNPVAVLINKALIEIPPKFSDKLPVFPGLVEGQIRSWEAAEGLAADVRAYGQWIRDEAEKRIGHLYPSATMADGSTGTVIAWIWARTVKCPNPACGIEMPLVASWWLGKKKGREVYTVPSVVAHSAAESGKRVEFSIGRDPRGPATDGTVNRHGATCVACESLADLKYVRAEGRSKRLGATLMAVVAERDHRREYLPADNHHVAAATIDRPEGLTDAALPEQALSFRVQVYGMTKWVDLFTNRQLVALTTFSDLVAEARRKVYEDAIARGLSPGTPLEQGGLGAQAYADAVATYLSFGVDKLTLTNVTLATWQTNPERLTQAYSRQAIPMTWDFAEANPLSSAGGGYGLTAIAIGKVLERLRGSRTAEVRQGNAADSFRDRSGALISTDPPYYDNIGYSDLSDYFYVWQRRVLRDTYPDLLGTLLVPKAEELVANPYRHGGTAEAREFFESGFREVFSRAREGARADAPITVYYAFKQSESSSDGTTSKGWETLLDGMIGAGWSITATWPVRTELTTSLKATIGALASSIVLSLRPRPTDAPTVDRQGLVAALHSELPGALRRLQQGQVAPVDLPQAAIGPGMAVFSRYSSVVEADGSRMTVRSALARINEILDQVLAEQEGDFDGASRFAIAWYRQNGYGTGTFGAADDLARARNTSVDLMDRHGILVSRAGKVTLIKPADLPVDYDPAADSLISNWEALHHLIRVLESDGIATAGTFLVAATSRPDGAVDADLVKELAFLLFSVAEKNGWTKDALSFNALAQSWPDIVAASRSDAPAAPQGAFEFDEDDE